MFNFGTHIVLTVPSELRETRLKLKQQTPLCVLQDENGAEQADIIYITKLNGIIRVAHHSFSKTHFS